jgi:hypothetical protein
MHCGCITTYVGDEQDNSDSRAVVGQQLQYRHTVDRILIALGILVFAVASGVFKPCIGGKQTHQLVPATSDSSDLPQVF